MKPSHSRNFERSPNKAFPIILATIPKRKVSHCGFTLAEVLITLTIVGVIAAITIPNLISKYQEHAWHQQWKDDYTMINNALKMVATEEPDLVVSDKNSYVFTSEFIDTFLSKLKVVDTCQATGTNGCYNNKYNHTTKYKWSGTSEAYSRYLSLSGVETGGEYLMQRAALLKNGAAIYFGGGVRGLTIVVDINNYTQGPNVYGKDVYALNIVRTNYRTSLHYYYSSVTADDTLIEPYGSPNRKNLGEGTKGCSPSIGVQNYTHTLPEVAGVGCSYKYLYEK